MSSGIDTEVKGTTTDDQGSGPDLDLEISAGKVEQKSPIKKPQFVMPKISLSKIKVPKSQSQSPKAEANATLPKTEIEADDSIKIPDIEKSHPEGTEEGAQISIKLADTMVRTLEFSRVETEASKTEITVSSAKIDASLTPSEGSFQQVDLKISSTNECNIQKTGIKLPRGEASEKEIKLKEHEIKAEEVQTEEHQGWFKMPKFRIPAFGRSSLKGKKSNADIESSMEKAQAAIPSAKELGDSVKSSDVSLPKMEGDTSLSTERTDSRVNIQKTETYADIVKRSVEGHTSEITVSAAELSKSHPSSSETDKDKSSANRFPEHKGKLQDTEVPKVERTAEMQLQKTEGSIGLESQALDHKETSVRIMGETVDQTQAVPEVTVRIPKLKIPRFTCRTLPIEADVLLSKVVTDPKGSTKSKILTLTEPDIKTAQMTATIESSLSSAGQDIHWSYIEGQEVSEKVEPEHVAIERCEIYTTEIVKESEILTSEVKTAALGFSLLKTKLPESHSDLDVLVQQPSPTGDASVRKPTGAGESFGVAAQRMGSAELKLSEKPHHESEESRGKVSLTKVKTSSAEVKCSSKVESPEDITAAPPSKDEDVVEAVEGEEKDITNEKEKTDIKRSPGRFKFWLPSIGFSSSGDETSTDAKPEIKKSVPEDVKPADTSDDSSKQAEKPGWFRLPKLGFTSPSKKAKSVDKEEVGHKEERLSDEDSPTDKPDVFFDAQESLSPKEIGEGEKAEIDGASSIVTSSARTELILLEEEKDSKSNIIPEP
uniref:Protein AHNAK2 n=1 Tax=Cyanoderma ruficeps TaxID=181631 RepID=A0A8C3P2J8_9PASS